jgi:hypothetical protein
MAAKKQNQQTIAPEPMRKLRTCLYYGTPRILAAAVLSENGADAFRAFCELDHLAESSRIRPYVVETHDTRLVLISRSAVYMRGQELAQI